MGNDMSSCFNPAASKPAVRLVFWGGGTQLLPTGSLAGELMLQFPDRVVCDADSFFIGRPVPILSLGDELLPGHTYFVIPVDRFPCQSLTAASLAALSPSPSARKSPLAGCGGKCPFEYVRGADGSTHVKVLPEFMAKVIMASEGGGDGGDAALAAASPLCSTPELRKHYAQLVGSRERPWSPKLETIAEKKARLSPVRMLGLDRRISLVKPLKS